MPIKNKTLPQHFYTDDTKFSSMSIRDSLGLTLDGFFRRFNSYMITRGPFTTEKARTIADDYIGLLDNEKERSHAREGANTMFYHRTGKDLYEPASVSEYDRESH